MTRVAPLVSRHVATIPVTLPRQGPQYPLGNLIADAQRWAGKGDVAIMNNGGIRTEVRAGDATYGSLFEVQPFGNTLYSLTMTGVQLRGLLEAMLSKSAPEAEFCITRTLLTKTVPSPASWSTRYVCHALPTS